MQVPGSNRNGKSDKRLFHRAKETGIGEEGHCDHIRDGIQGAADKQGIEIFFLGRKRSHGLASKAIGPTRGYGGETIEKQDKKLESCAGCCK